MRYVAQTPIEVHPGGSRVRLTAAQAERCKHLVTAPDADGFVTAVVPFTFKAGEAFEMDAELPKGMADAAAPAARPAPKAPAAKTAAEAKA